MSKCVVTVSDKFKESYPFTAKAICDVWSKKSDCAIIEHKHDESLSSVLKSYKAIDKLAALGANISNDCYLKFPECNEVCINAKESPEFQKLKQVLLQKNVAIYEKKGEGHWGQSVSEFALALTLNALRNIPNAIDELKTKPETWDYSPKYSANGECLRAHQYCDSNIFTSGTVEGKKIRIVGAGNIASRYASFVSMLGADVKMWDPFANEPCFHRSGAQRVFHLEDLIQDAEIFVPMVPLTDSTQGLITAEQINQIPTGALVIMVTRAQICNFDALYQRIQKGDLFLAADVFNVEPLPKNHILLNCPNVILTPHMAGRSRDANIAYANAVLALFRTTSTQVNAKNKNILAMA